ncbi:MAG: hypothetical protein AAF191_17120, partial [Verrucomicrobiota bacterium]
GPAQEQIPIEPLEVLLQTSVGILLMQRAELPFDWIAFLNLPEPHPTRGAPEDFPWTAYGVALPYVYGFLDDT